MNQPVQTLRTVTVEATARRFGVFFYVVLGLFIALLLAVVGNQSHAAGALP